MYIFILGLILLVCGCHGPGTEPSTPAISRGRAIGDADLPAVVRVLQSDGKACSGSIVQAGAILTAAHCTLGLPVTVLGRVPKTILRAVDTAGAGPDDLALILYEPKPSDPEPLLLAEKGNFRVGTCGRIAGFGAEDPTSERGIGSKRVGENCLSSADELLLIVSCDRDGDLRSNIAPGDSGGPFLVNGKLLGVATGLIHSGQCWQGWFVNLTSETSRVFLKERISENPVDKLSGTPQAASVGLSLEPINRFIHAVEGQ